MKITLKKALNRVAFNAEKACQASHNFVQFDELCPFGEQKTPDRLKTCKQSTKYSVTGDVEQTMEYEFYEAQPQWCGSIDLGTIGSAHFRKQ
jgi:hypothetical protein